MSLEGLIRAGEMSERQARSLAEYIKADGPAPMRSGTRTIVVIGDPHAEPGQDLGRFDALGRMVVELDPDVVVCVGDWTDNHATGRFDRNTYRGEGARLVADIEAGNEALRRFHRPIADFNESNPHLSRNPRLVMCLGNHEERLDAFANQNPMLVGLVGSDMLAYRARGWEVVPFTRYASSDGVWFTHYVQTGNGKAKSGVHLAHNIGIEKRTSFVVGHTHGFDYKIKTDHECGVDQRELVAGCFFEHWENYAGQNNAAWWRGICVLRDVRDGRYDLEQWDLARILRRWGER